MCVCGQGLTPCDLITLWLDVVPAELCKNLTGMKLVGYISLPIVSPGLKQGPGPDVPSPTLHVCASH